MGIENKQKKNKIDIHSSEHKEKLRQRFLERQKLTQSIDDKPAKEIKTKKNNKYYEGSSEEEEDDAQEKPTEIANKTSTEVLKTFKSFSNIWQDSDDEKDDDDEHDSDSSSDSSSQDQDDEEDDEEQLEERRA